jgi:hypothetical protein
MSDQGSFASETESKPYVDYMLTTVDNPWNPFTQFDEWMAFDYAHSYHTMELLARITFDSEELSDADQAQALQEGIDEVVRENVSGMYRKVSRFDFDDSK